MKIKYSIVIPIYNEENIIPELYSRTTKVLGSVDKTGYEIIFVDDGSNDHSLEILEKLYKKDSKIKIVSLSRNFGHQEAISAGIDFAKGNAVITMDGDLQDPPEIIIEFIKEWGKNCKIVYGIRKNTKESFQKRVFSKMFYRVFNKLSNVKIPLDAGDFCLMDREIVDILVNLPEKVRFLRGIRPWIGFKQGFVKYNRDKRYGGKAKYTINKSTKLAINALASFSYLPLHLFVGIGFFTSLFSFIGIVLTIIAKFAGIEVVKGWTSTIMVILLLGGIQLIMLGIIGEYIEKIFEETKHRPLYIVNKLVGITPNQLPRGRQVSK
ncbi:MAG: glycosyltransferase family 2 protein [bacterium]|nr:glycosyltransferase family 2 protein [bacterium]